MTPVRHSRQVILALLVGVVGAIAGALSAYEGDVVLQIIMALVGFLFGTAVGAFLIVVAKVMQGRSGHPVRREPNPRMESSIESQESVKLLDDCYPGNPDPLSRKLTGWRLPSERR